jgi:zinc-ribbon domain
VPEGTPRRCPRCEADTPDGAKFCIECGDVSVNLLYGFEQVNL